MPFALDIPIPIGIGKVVGAYIHHVVVQHIQDVNTGQAAASMPRAALFNDFENSPSILNRFKFERLDIHPRVLPIVQQC
jgi:hypothetical protein